MTGAAAKLARRGLMLVLSSPSGAGKTTLSRALLAADPAITMSVSVTTRPPRPSEVEGYDYHFVNKSKFDAMITGGELLEWACVFDHLYGTPRAPVDAALARGRDVLFDIDWQGSQQLRRLARSDLVSVFVLPPSADELERRLRRRAQDQDQVIRRRMTKAASELEHWTEYDYVVINHDFEPALAAIRCILASERLRRDRQSGLPDFVRGIRARL
jgi:guanylate kinase